MSETFVGRCPFPLIVLRNCKISDQTDVDTITRSLRMTHGFHGAVSLEGASRDTYLKLRKAGWNHNDGVRDAE